MIRPAEPSFGKTVASYVAVCALALALCVALAAAAWCSREPLAIPIDTADTSDGVAATVNGVAIGENAITAYLDEFRMAQGLEEDGQWGAWLVENGYTPHMMRRDTVDSFIGMEIMRQAAEQLGSQVSDAEVDEQVRLARSSIVSGDAWGEYLQRTGLSNAAFRQGVESSLLDAEIAKRVSLGEGGSEDRSKAVAKWVEEFKSDCSIQVCDMPEGLAYDIGLAPYRGRSSEVDVENKSSIDSSLWHAEEEINSEKEEGGSAASIKDLETFDRLREVNPDVYAWLYVPGTNVSLPVLQNTSSDEVYLYRDALGRRSAAGSVYTERANARDFFDPVTVLYGHSFSGTDVSFSQLHRFENPAFFEKHPEFFIYLQDRVITYQVVSAYIYDGRHLLRSFDFEDQGVLQKCFDYAVNPDSAFKNVREGVTVDAENDRIVQLSTCTLPASGDLRYIVTGVFAEERFTEERDVELSQ